MSGITVKDLESMMDWMSTSHSNHSYNKSPLPMPRWWWALYRDSEYYYEKNGKFYYGGFEVVESQLIPDNIEFVRR